MPSVFVETPQFPSVPQLPGVPPLNLNPLAAFPLPIAVTSDAVGLSNLGRIGRWGIYSSQGRPVLTADSVFAMEYARDWRVSNYPQTEGAFASYNKVKTPFQAKVTFLIGNSRIDFLQAAEAAVASLNLVSIITPEISYASANLTHYAYRRVAAEGVTLIAVEVWAEEIRVVSAASLSNGQSTNAASPQNDGTVQPTQADANSAGNPVTPKGVAVTADSSLQAGLGSPAGATGSTTLGTTIGSEIGTKFVTELQPGLSVAPPDVAFTFNSPGDVFVVPIPPP